MGTCSICNGSRFIRVGNDFDGDVEWKLCSCQEKELDSQIIARILKVTRIPELYWNKKYEEFDWPLLRPYSKSGVITAERSKIAEIVSNSEVVKDKLNKYMSDPVSFMTDPFNALWIWGADPNTGHSTLACILGIKLVKAGYNVRYYDMQSLTKAILEYKDADVMAEMESAMNRFDVFIIDDAFDKTKSYLSNSDYVNTSLFNFFKKALDKNKKLICTCSVDVDNLPDEYVSVVSLLIRSYKPIHMIGSFNDKIKRESMR